MISADNRARTKFFSPVGITSILLLIILLFSTGTVLHYTNAQTSDPSTQVNFAPKINLSNDAGSSTVPVVAASGSHVYVGWHDDSATPGSSKTYVRVSADGGSTWNPVVRFLGTGKALAMRIYAEGSDVYLVWQQGGSVKFVASNDNGETFNPVMTVSPSGAAQPVVSASGSNVYVAWVQTSGTSKTIQFRSSHNDGSTFGATQILGTGREEEVSAVGNFVYVIWTLPPVQIRVSSDSGNTFAPVVRLSSPSSCSPNALSREPKMAAFGNNVYVTWTTNSPGNYEAFIDVSHNNGASGSWTCHNLSNDPASSREVEVAAYGTNVYAVFRDNTGGRVDEYISVSHDSGTTFAPKVDLSNTRGPQNGFGQVAAFENNAYVIWPDSELGNSQVYFRASQDAGSTFATTQNLSNSPGTALVLNDPGDEGDVIMAIAGHLYVVWQDNSPGNNDIFFRSATI